MRSQNGIYGERVLCPETGDFSKNMFACVCVLVYIYKTYICV